MLTNRPNHLVERLGGDDSGGGLSEAREAIPLKGMIDAIFALACAERDASGLKADQFDHEARAAVLPGSR